MATLTHQSLLKYLIEESYELVEAIEESHPPAEVRGELGDILLQVVLHARLAEEAGEFVLADVVRGLTEKMVRRNQHVFTPSGELRSEFPATIEQIVTSWHQAKSSEKPERGRFEGIPATLPALALAQKSLQRVAEGFQNREAGAEQTARAEAEIQLGERLLELLRGSPDVDAERALRLAVRRMQESHHE
ncbi:MazG nucleotide pyrophosphohydrolase domain-containing protein [Psychromicrobium lacuslunae]|nr:MazG nucleotide pyrophosphohydrolase domain-containing protein [Psychromicrobium lacuslunae]